LKLINIAQRREHKIRYAKTGKQHLRTKTENNKQRRTLRRRNHKTTKEIINICENHIYLTKIEEKNNLKG
jgi:hypothetical protein